MAGGIAGDVKACQDLADAIQRNLGFLAENVDEMSNALSALRGGWEDEKYEEVVEVVTAMKAKVGTMSDAVQAILPQLMYYQEYLQMLLAKGIL